MRDISRDEQGYIGLSFRFLCCLVLVHEVLYCVLQTTGQIKGVDESTASESFLPFFLSPFVLCTNP